MDRRLQELKAELGQWERDYKAMYGRPPKSQDTPPAILTLYKEYATLKQKSDQQRNQKGMLDEEETVKLPRLLGKTTPDANFRPSTLASFTSSLGCEEFSMQSSHRSLSSSVLRNSLCAPSLCENKRPWQPTPAAPKDSGSGERSADSRNISIDDPNDHSENATCPSRAPFPLANVGHVVSAYDLLESDDEDDSDSLEGDDSERDEISNHLLSAPNTNQRDPVEMKSEIRNSSTQNETSRTTGSSIFSGFPKNEQNFVRLNMKRDWRAKKKNMVSYDRVSKAKIKSRAFFSRDDAGSHRQEQPNDAVDTVLDILDAKDSGKVKREPVEKIPRCGHDAPCAELVVKKASSGNKGRVFYGCSFGREGSCGFFMWKDDTLSAARAAFTERLKPLAVGSVDGNSSSREECAQLPPRWIDTCGVSELKLHIQRLGGTVTGKKRANLIEELRSMWVKRVAEARDLATKESLDADEVLERIFFHDCFFPGQREAIEQVMNGKNTLVVRATGSGKSLIYQLPAYMLPGITVVVTPLISLMQDQLVQLPPGLRGCSLNGTQKEQAEAVADLVSGKAKLLFISPERIFTSSFQTLLKRLPPVALMCIDEAHCMSSWSHNFRPSYLRLGVAIQTLFSQATVLALTATATVAVQEEVCRILGIEVETGVKLEGSWDRSNLKLKIEPAPISEDKRVMRLVELLKSTSGSNKVSEGKKKIKLESSSEKDIASTIVYATTKMDTRVLAERLENYAINAAPYHSGMDSSERKKVQASFLHSKLPVVVATVAFGMGLNKRNVRRVIHYRAPRSIEEYVQEIGRAGRDGENATCVCLFDADGEESRRLLSLARSDGVEPAQIKLLLSRLAKSLRPDSFVALYPDEFVLAADCKEGVVETILVFLANLGMIELGPSGYGRAEIAFGPEKSSVPQIVQLARRLCVISEGKNRVELVRLAEVLSTKETVRSVSSVIRELCDARDKDHLINFSLMDRCWFVKRSEHWRSGEWSADNEQRLSEYCEALEERSCGKIRALFSAMAVGMEDCDLMKKCITTYLEDKTFQLDKDVPFDVMDEIARRAIKGDILSLLKDPQFTAVNPKELQTSRAVARILHAVGSPAFPYDRWSSHRLWGRYKTCRFEDLKLFAIQLMEGRGPV